MGTKKSAVLYAGVVSWQYKSERWTKHQQLFYEYKIPGLNPTAFIFLYRLTLRLPEDFDPFKPCTCYFWFSLQMVTHQKLWKMLFISSKKPYPFSRYSNICNFFPSFSHFADSEGQMEQK